MNEDLRFLYPVGCLVVSKSQLLISFSSTFICSWTFSFIPSEILIRSGYAKGKYLDISALTRPRGLVAEIVGSCKTQRRLRKCDIRKDMLHYLLRITLQVYQPTRLTKSWLRVVSSQLPARIPSELSMLTAISYPMESC